MTDRAVLTIDVELFTQTPAYRAATGSVETNDGDGPAGDERAGLGLAGLAFLEEAISDRDATATCFVVSSVAADHPEAVASLAERGFEIGSHTHSHRRLSDLEPADRRSELTRSKELLERTTDASVEGFRAPVFDVTPDMFDLLGDAGYAYDASVVPSRQIPGWYGGEFDRRRPGPATTIDADAPETLAELPAGVMPGIGLPLTGTWLRFFGPRYTLWGMRLLARRGVAPVLYVHPWEFVDLPAVDGVPKRVYWHTGDWMRRAIGRILDAPFEFTTAQSVLTDELDERQAGPDSGGDGDGDPANDGDPPIDGERADGRRDQTDREVER